MTYLARLAALRRRRPAAPSFTCPVCQMTSHNPYDVAEGYCGNCHDWTGAPQR